MPAPNERVGTRSVRVTHLRLLVVLDRLAHLVVAVVHVLAPHLPRRTATRALNRRQEGCGVQRGEVPG
jgi:hypothetical protein